MALVERGKLGMWNLGKSVSVAQCGCGATKALGRGRGGVCLIHAFMANSNQVAAGANMDQETTAIGSLWDLILCNLEWFSWDVTF